MISVNSLIVTAKLEQYIKMNLTWKD
jgi:hypothetical protein